MCKELFNSFSVNSPLHPIARPDQESKETKRKKFKILIKVTVQFERCFWIMEHISVILCHNPIIIIIILIIIIMIII